MPLPAGAAGASLSPAGWAIVGVGVLISLVLVVIVLMRYAFAFPLAADGLGTLDAFGRSAEMTKGIRLKLFLMFIVITLFVYVGLLGLVIGIFFTGAIGNLIMISIYLQALPQAEAQPEESPEPAA